MGENGNFIRELDVTENESEYSIGNEKKIGNCNVEMRGMRKWESKAHFWRSQTSLHKITAINFNK